LVKGPPSLHSDTPRETVTGSSKTRICNLETLPSSGDWSSLRQKERIGMVAWKMSMP
jgi:hypothetical protein